MSREGGDVFFSYNESCPTESKGDSLRNRMHCGGQTSCTVRSTTKQMHTHPTVHAYTSACTHTYTYSCTLAYVGFFHGPFHFTWSCDMAMMMILSFWIVIALSSLEHCQRGRRERKADRLSEGEDDNKVRVRKKKSGRNRQMKQKRLEQLRDRVKREMSRFLFLFNPNTRKKIYSNASVFQSSSLSGGWYLWFSFSPPPPLSLSDGAHIIITRFSGL